MLADFEAGLEYASVTEVIDVVQVGTERRFKVKWSDEYPVSRCVCACVGGGGGGKSDGWSCLHHPPSSARSCMHAHIYRLAFAPAVHAPVSSERARCAQWSRALTRVERGRAEARPRRAALRGCVQASWEPEEHLAEDLIALFQAQNPELFAERTDAGAAAARTWSSDYETQFAPRAASSGSSNGNGLQAGHEAKSGSSSSPSGHGAVAGGSVEQKEAMAMV